MRYTVFFYVVLTLLAVKLGQIQSLQYDTMDTYKKIIDVRGTNGGTFSSGILKSHSGSTYTPNRVKTLTISAPTGYSLFAAFSLLDLRPNSQDSITLVSVGEKSRQYTYSNAYGFKNRKYYHNEDVITFYAPKGQIAVTFSTGPYYYTGGYDGFELVYTTQTNWTNFNCDSSNFQCNNGRCIANALRCDDHNHCGDRSDQRYSYCYDFPATSRGTTVGIISGVVFLGIAIACGIFIVVRRARSRTEIRGVITTHPPTNNLSSYPPSYPQPGTCYPPPPPAYSQYNQGVTNPGYQ
jgi:hypothetical protein